MLKKAIAGAVCVGFTAAPSLCAWKLITIYPTPVFNPRGYQAGGIAFGYIVGGSLLPHVYGFQLTTGSIVSSFPAPGGVGAWGITEFLDAFYISNNRTSWIYTVTSGGSVINSFPCPVAGPADMDHMSFPGHLYIAIPERNIIAVVHEKTGSLLTTFKAPGSQPTACCGSGTILIADAATHTVYEDGVPVITGIDAPVGADELTSGRRYWVFVVDNAAGQICWYEKLVAVVPASLGRIKALFE
jgi:hypothetical protein